MISKYEYKAIKLLFPKIKLGKSMIIKFSFIASLMSFNLKLKYDYIKNKRYSL